MDAMQSASLILEDNAGAALRSQWSVSYSLGRQEYQPYGAWYKTNQWSAMIQKDPGRHRDADQWEAVVRDCQKSYPYFERVEIELDFEKKGGVSDDRERKKLR